MTTAAPSAPGDHFTIISSDSHAGASHATYREYLDPEYREFLPQHVAEHEAFLSTIGGTI